MRQAGRTKPLRHNYPFYDTIPRYRHTTTPRNYDTSARRANHETRRPQPPPSSSPLSQREFGFGDGRVSLASVSPAPSVSMHEALSLLRSAAPRHQTICWWQRLVQHKARRGTLERGNDVPDVRVYGLDTKDGAGDGGGGGAGGGEVEGGRDRDACAVTANEGALALRTLIPADGRPLGVVALSYS